MRRVHRITTTTVLVWTARAVLNVVLEVAIGVAGVVNALEGAEKR